MQIRESRPEDGPAIARVQVDTWRSAYRGQISDEYLDNLDYSKAEKNGPAAIARGEGRDVFMFVAVDDADAVVGFAVGGRERDGVPDFAGELHALYVSPSFQRSGAGRALVEAVAKRLLDQGHSSMIVWTLIGNAARGFYERLGGTFTGTSTIDLGGVSYQKVAYGWPDITILTSL